MANFEFSKRIKTNVGVNPQDIKGFIKDRLSKSCKYDVISENENLLVVEGGVKESVLTPVVKFKAEFEIKCDEKNSRLYVDISSAVNGIFWIFLVIGIAAYGTLIFVPLGLFLTQANKPKKTIGRVIEAVETEFSLLE